MRKANGALTAAAEPLVAKKLHALGRKQGIPVAGTFELTAACNFQCPACYIHQNSVDICGNQELSAAEWLRIGREATDAGTVFLLLTGGKPLLRPDFEEIYIGLKKMGFVLSINTNGFFLTGKTAALLEKNSPSRLNISLYADSPEGYLRQCGMDAFGLVTDNIRRMRQAGVEIKLNVLFTRYNADCCDGIAALAEEMGLHAQASAYVYPPVRCGGGNGGKSPLAAGCRRCAFALGSAAWRGRKQP